MTPVQNGDTAREHTESLGLTLFLGAWSMLFAGLFFADGAIRSRATTWPPNGMPSLPQGLPALGALFLLASSFVLTRWVSRRTYGRSFQTAATLTVILGLSFLAIQGATWRFVGQNGLRPSLGGYPSAFWALTVIHAAHAAVGVIALWVLWIRPPRLPVLRRWAVYWHFVAATGIITWMVVFL